MFLNALKKRYIRRKKIYVLFYLPFFKISIANAGNVLEENTTLKTILTTQEQSEFGYMRVNLIYADKLKQKQVVFHFVENEKK